MIKTSELESVYLDVKPDIGQFALENMAVDYYEQHYVAPGRDAILTHDGQTVLFYENRVAHAFKTTPRALKTVRKQHQKRPEWDPERVRRAPWIGPLIAGEIEGGKCRLVPHACFGLRADSLLYSIRHFDLWSYYYVVWLEPHRYGGFWFSSAYLANGYDMHRYLDQPGVETIR